MKITHYSFGSITVNGTTYTSDIIIFPDHIQSPWWRQEGHLLQIPDLKDVVGKEGALFIIGTGYYEMMKVPEETIRYLKSLEMDVHIHNSKDAVRLYNELSSKKQTILAIHLTC